MSQIFSASIADSAGLSSIEPIPGLPGWTVDRQGQTAFYKINHNLHLSNPETQLQVFVSSDLHSPDRSHSPDLYYKAVEVFSQESDSFLIRTLEIRTSRPEFYEHSGPFTFIALLKE